MKLLPVRRVPLQETTVTELKMALFLGVTPCSVVEEYREDYRVYHQNHNIPENSSLHTPSHYDLKSNSGTREIPGL